MTVAELIAALSVYPADLQVVSRLAEHGGERLADPLCYTLAARPRPDGNMEDLYPRHPDDAEPYPDARVVLYVGADAQWPEERAAEAVVAGWLRPEPPPPPKEAASTPRIRRYGNTVLSQFLETYRERRR